MKKCFSIQTVFMLLLGLSGSTFGELRSKADLKGAPQMLQVQKVVRNAAQENTVSARPSSHSQTPKCTDTDEGINPKVFGRILIEVVDSKCAQTSASAGDSDLRGKTCMSFSVADPDYCQNDRTLVERYCDEVKGPSQKQISCHCRHGACR